MSIFLDKQTNRDMRLIALLKKLSCFLKASAALLGEVQVCILVGHQQGLVEPLICLCFSITKSKHIVTCFLEASAALLGQVQVCILVAHQQSPVEP